MNDGPDPIATRDQLQAGLGDMASMVGGYYRELRAAGLPDELWFRLVEQVHAIAIEGSDEGEDDES